MIAFCSFQVQGSELGRDHCGHGLDHVRYCTKRDIRSGPAHTMQDDPFRILGLSRDASQEEIKKRYLELAKQWHPDTCHHKDEGARLEAETEFKRIQRAFTNASMKYRSPGNFGNPYVWLQISVRQSLHLNMILVNQAHTTTGTPHTLSPKHMLQYLIGFTCLSTGFVIFWTRMMSSRDLDKRCAPNPVFSSSCVTDNAEFVLIPA